MRTIRQPGPAAVPRIVAVEAVSLPIDVMLQPGRPLLDALAGLLAGADSLCLSLHGGAFGPFAYVIPALSPDPHHAAFYSDIRTPPGTTRLDAAAVTVGTRDGQPFFHCHALWTDADGRRGCGHVLPEGTVIAAPIHATGAALFGARFQTAPDAETGFNLLSPVPTTTRRPAAGRPALALRLAPNQQLAQALESAGAGAGFDQAMIAGGVASTIGARFTNAPPLETFATELLVRQGRIACRPGAETEIDIAIVDLHGTIAEGRLDNADNPVLMTFEGALLPV